MKTKKYIEGGEIILPQNVGEPLKMASFKEAFAEARNRGDKTFEYMGKKYTTEMAKPRSESRSEPRVEPTVLRKTPDINEEISRLIKRSPSTVPRTDLSNMKPASTRLGMANIGMKKGGYVRSADGCVKKGKTHGKIV